MQPVKPMPPHCPYLATVHPPGEAVVVAAWVVVVEDLEVVDVVSVVALVVVVVGEPPPLGGLPLQEKREGPGRHCQRNSQCGPQAVGNWRRGK